MAAIKLQQSEARHEAGMMQQLRRLRTQGRFCDVAVKSRDGTEQRAHSAVLCAGSSFFDSLLGGSFLEADQMQQGQPVEIAASDAAVSALLDYIYGGLPEVRVEDSIELLRLADAYHFPNLTAATEAGLQTFLDTSGTETADMEIALKILQQTQGLYALKSMCEHKVASNFVACVEHPGFLKLSGGQLGRLLARSDLKVTREEEVLKGLIQWFKESADRGDVFAALLRHVDFPSISLENLARIGRFASSMGPHGDDLQREVDEASRTSKKRSVCEAPDVYRPKRRCFQHWSPYLGASCSGSGRKMLLGNLVRSLSWHDGAIYADDGGRILRWKPGDAEPQVVAGIGARVAGINDVGLLSCVSVSPDGRLFVADTLNNRLLCFRDGSGQLVLGDVSLVAVSCPPNGTVYVLDHGGTAVQKLVGSTLETVIDSANLPEDLQFRSGCLFVTREEAIYLCDQKAGRVLRFSTGETPVVLGHVPESENSMITALSATDDGKVFVADAGQNKVWAFCPPDTACSEVLKHDLDPTAVLVHDQSLYVALFDMDERDGIYEYSLPPEFQP